VSLVALVSWGRRAVRQRFLVSRPPCACSGAAVLLLPDAWLAVPSDAPVGAVCYAVCASLVFFPVIDLMALWLVIRCVLAVLLRPFSSLLFLRFHEVWKDSCVFFPRFFPVFFSLFCVRFGVNKANTMLPYYAKTFCDRVILVWICFDLFWIGSFPLCTVWCSFARLFERPFSCFVEFATNR